ncbi:LOW QUALITY PROTEIN: Cleavage inducible protein [Phytophthora palmivora]|uniref:Cleavage inducible protein n=1 Tax=Phytophthora palmivora TaxID=4796 RepID=A0A2P4YHX4_9STRA|nr:LOW QUALITY PROTEIN: Cleavage inducible protein [Phytophthora palmivora]
MQGASEVLVDLLKQSLYEKELLALQRAYATLGEEVVKQLQSAYGALDLSNKGKQQADGMILSLVKQNVPDTQVRAVFKVGGYNIGQLKLIKEGEDDILPTRDHVPPKHAFRKDDVQFSAKYAASGIRGMDTRVLIEVPATKQKLPNDAQLGIAGSLNMFTFIFLESVFLTDVCDACVRIDTALLRRDLTELERSELLQDKAVHVEAAINQRRAMTQFVKEYVAVHAPEQHQPEEVIAEHIEVPLEERAANQREELTLLIQIDDFGKVCWILNPYYKYYEDDII